MTRVLSQIAEAIPRIGSYITAENAALAWIGAKSWLRAHLWGIETKKPNAYKIYAFNQSGEGFCHAVFSPTRYDLEDVRDSITWDAYKIDVRYVYRGQKFRVLYRDDDDDREFPLPRQMGMVIAPKLVKAVLVRKHDDKEFDVTERVRKYMGPDRDFYKKHGLYVRVQDMFPFDDHTDNAERFRCVRLHLSTGKFIDFEYDANEIMTT